MICWVFAFCQAVDVVKISLATSTVWIAEHLTKKHQQVKPSKTGHITLDGSGSEKTDLTLSRRSALLPVTPEQVGIIKLRLITWMVKKHISYSQVEDKDFQKFIDSCSLGAVSAKVLLPRSGDTIRSWILDEYKQRKIHLCEKVLAYAAFVVHISFDLWTAPNNTAYIDIVIHFLDQNKQLCTVLLTVRNMHGDHSGKNQAKAILPVFVEYLLKAKLGYFITDNASLNDTCITEIIDLIRLNLDAKERRL